MDEMRSRFPEYQPPYNFEGCMADTKEWLKNANHVAVLSGAGISAESGIATFRDAKTGALWDKFDPKKLASMSGFEEDPPLVWEWYMGRIADCKVCKPNDGHVALGELEKHKLVTIVTQNVDDLHEVGGSHRVFHLHGDLASARCHAGCGWSDSVETLELVPGSTPVCPKCGSMARPNVVWFGEMLDQNVVDNATAALENADLLLVVGTSSQVYPAAGMPWYTKRNGGKVVSINTRHVDHCGDADRYLTGKSSEILRELVDSLKNT